jgi:hypothetical protein
MRRLLTAAALLCVGFSTQTFAQTIKATSGRSASADTSLQQKILTLEAKRIGAMVSKDIATLDALLGDDLSYTHSGGTTDTKASFMTLIRERGRYLGIDYSGTQVIPLSGNTVVVRGRALIRLESTPSYTVLFLDVWALRDGAWKMVAWQATRLTE